MIILGIDPGIATTGFAFLTVEKGSVKKCSWGTIKTSHKEPSHKRLLQLRQDLLKIIKNSKPDKAAVEKLYFQSNAKTAMIVGEARGVILTTLAENNIPIQEFTPLEVKRTVTGSGNADKKQVQKMLTILFHLPQAPKPDDAADAVAIAYCASGKLL